MGCYANLQNYWLGGSMKRTLISYVAGLFTPLAAAVLIHAAIGGFSRLERGYNKIHYGMSRAQVSEIMGSPGKTASEFYLAQLAGYEMEYAVAGKLGAAYFVSWHGSDTTFTVAFDSADRVIYKAKGCS